MTHSKGANNVETEGTLSTVWDTHVGAEFGAKDADQAAATMTAEAYVNLIPLMIGARGREAVRDFYAKRFLPKLPPDIEIVPVSRTIGQSQVVDELKALPSQEQRNALMVRYIGNKFEHAAT